MYQTKSTSHPSMTVARRPTTTSRTAACHATADRMTMTRAPAPMAATTATEDGRGPPPRLRVSRRSYSWPDVPDQTRSPRVVRHCLGRRRRIPVAVRAPKTIERGRLADPGRSRPQRRQQTRPDQGLARRPASSPRRRGGGRRQKPRRPGGRGFSWPSRTTLPCPLQFRGKRTAP